MKDLAFNSPRQRQRDRALDAPTERAAPIPPPTDLPRCQHHPNEGIGPYGCRACNAINQAKRKRQHPPI